MHDVTAAFRGVTAPVGELTQKIEQLGWTPGPVKFKDDRYVASATYQGEKVEKTGITEATAVANVLRHITRKHQIRSRAQVHVGMWQTTFTDKLPEVAEAYSKAPIYDPKAVIAWKALADDSVRRAQVLGDQLHIQQVHDPEPYKSAQDMFDDIYKKRHLYVSRANADHPVWSEDQVVAFRIVHDVMGHCVSGGDWSWHGENLACAAHFPLLSADAQKALFTESLGRAAYENHFHGYAPTKIAFLADHIEPAQDTENKPGHYETHPGLTLAPVLLPGEKGRDKTSRHKTADTAYADPNASWSSGIDPMQLQQDPLTGEVTNPGNARIDHGDPLGAEAVRQNASLTDSGWSQWLKDDGTPDYDRMKQAIINAFRAVLLSPKKVLYWNAIHYQHLMSVPHSVTDPKVYWDALENKRRSWNESRGFDRDSHMVYFKYLRNFEAIVARKHPELSPQDAHTRAEDILWEWWVQEEQEIQRDNAEKPEEQQPTADEVERLADKGLADRLKVYVGAEFNRKTDRKHKLTEEGVPRVYDRVQQSYAAAEEEGEDEPQIDSRKYGAFMGTHLRWIAGVSQHADELLKAALEDVVDHDGAGHHFRAAALQMDIKGVGPKVVSFAWLLLQPMTSQLATIDTHILDLLGHNEKFLSGNTRDYFRMERELTAGRDAAGYGDLPLGQFQWGMWDYKRTGEGSHQDHSPLKVADPTSYDDVDWAARQQPINAQEAQAFKQMWQQGGPDWWVNTKPYRQAVADDWEARQAQDFPKGAIPFQEYDPSITIAKVGAMSNEPVPWLYEEPGNIWTGAPGQTYAQMVQSVYGEPAHMYWQHERASLGKYDPSSDELVVAAGQPNEAFVRDHLRSVLRA